MERLAEIENIVGVKEASGNISQMAALLGMVPGGFLVLSGDDGITLPLMALGGRGVISVASNEIPAEMTRLVQLVPGGRFRRRARRIHRRYFPLMEVNFVETNPGPVKAAMALMGLLEPVFRLPLVPPKPENLAKIRSALESVGLGAGRPMLHVEIERLFDENPERYTDEHFASFPAIQGCAERGRDSRGGARCSVADRMARERVGEEGDSARASAWARWSICPSTRRGSRFSTRPLTR